METISIAIAVRDEKEAWRKKQGDIIAVMPGGHQWGTGEVLNHLILEVSLDGIDVGDRGNFISALTSRYFADGVLHKNDKALEKRRFKVDWKKLKSMVADMGIAVDWDKVEDVTVSYQPLNDPAAAPVFNATDLIHDKHHGRSVTSEDVKGWVW